MIEKYVFPIDKKPFIIVLDMSYQDYMKVPLNIKPRDDVLSQCIYLRELEGNNLATSIEIKTLNNNKDLVSLKTLRKRVKLEEPIRPQPYQLYSLAWFYAKYFTESEHRGTIVSIGNSSLNPKPLPLQPLSKLFDNMPKTPKENNKYNYSFSPLDFMDEDFHNRWRVYHINLLDNKHTFGEISSKEQEQNKMKMLSFTSILPVNRIFYADYKVLGELTRRIYEQV